jgi:hypothetical protein
VILVHLVIIVSTFINHKYSFTIFGYFPLCLPVQWQWHNWCWCWCWCWCSSSFWCWY